jgi:hypothetical protein
MSAVDTLANTLNVNRPLSPRGTSLGDHRVNIRCAHQRVHLPTSICILLSSREIFMNQESPPRPPTIYHLG